MDNNSLNKQFVNRISILRQNSAYSKKNMADFFNTSQNTYRRYERGEILPGFLSLYSVAMKLGISLDWLVGGRGPVFYQEKGEKKSTEVVPGTIQQVFSPEIANLIDHIERIPLLRDEMLAFFYKFKVEHRELIEKSKEETATLSASSLDKV